MATSARDTQFKFEPWKNPDAKPFVRIDRVTKKFGEFVAVDDVTLNIYQKEIFCLLGGSGCGKTTLLRMLAGFERPTAGRVFVDGVDVTNMPPYEQAVNMMFQSYALFPHMTVEQNVAFGLKQEKTPKAEMRDRVATMLEMVKLGPYAKRKPHQLSGGQRQRVALARALVTKPKLLLLDEPLAALDKKLREYTQFELINIQQQLGVTFIVVTHDQQEAMTLASRIGVMDHGRIVQVGTPYEIYNRPKNTFVATFVGSPVMNLLPARLTDGRMVIVPERLEIALEPAVLDRLKGRSGEVTVGVRSEDVEVRPGLPLEAQVYGVENHGVEKIVTLKACDFLLRATVPARTELSVDRGSTFAFNQAKLKFFDPASGAIIS